MKKTLIFFIALVCLLFMAAAHPPPPFHNDSLWRVYDNGDVTKRVAFEVDGISTGTTRTITMPDADVDLHTPTFDNVTTTHDLELTGGLDSDIVFYDGETWKAAIEWTDIGGTALKITSDSGYVNFDNEHLKTTGNLTDGTNSLTIANAKAAYTHISNNGSDHSYIDQDVTTAGTPDFNSITAYYQHWKNGIVVDAGGNLAEQYDWLKSADRDAAMGALSATNWRVLIFGPGVHTVVSTFTADTDYVAIVSLSGNYKDTRLVGDFADAVLEQTANIIALRGFMIYNNDTTKAWPPDDLSLGFLVNCSAGNNTGSLYHSMYFDTAADGRFLANLSAGVYCNTTERGTWVDCEATSYSWRMPENGDFGPTMYRCEGGDGCYAGDGFDTGNGSITGTFYNCIGGYYSFGGCSGYGVQITSDAYFESCEAGYNSYAMGKECAGTFIDCTGGDQCFGGYGSADSYGNFSGLAIGCRASNDSFGAGHASCKCSGTLIRCRVTAMPEAMYLDGARLEDTYLQITGANKHCIDLSSDTGTSKIYNSTLIANGTGNSIYADSAKNVIAAHCRMNKGVHGNVTNLIGTPYNVDDTDIE